MMCCETCACSQPEDENWMICTATGGDVTFATVCDAWMPKIGTVGTTIQEDILRWLAH